VLYDSIGKIVQDVDDGNIVESHCISNRFLSYFFENGHCLDVILKVLFLFAFFLIGLSNINENIGEFD
jgi:hypothetical protein